MVISALGWIVVGVAAWSVVAAVVGVLIGRVVRRRDRQVPYDAPTVPAQDIPGQGADPDPAPPPRVAGRGRPRRS